MNAPAVSQLPSRLRPYRSCCRHYTGIARTGAIHRATAAAGTNLKLQALAFVAGQAVVARTGLVMNAPAVSQLPSAPAGSQVLSSLH